MPDVNVPLLGSIPRKGIIIGVGGGALVVTYLLYKRHQETAAATASTGDSASASGYGYGTTAYGYGSGVPGYYGYGANPGGGYGYGGFAGSGGGYGYGSAGYGTQPSTAPPWWDNPPPWLHIPKTRSPKPGTSVITAQGNMDLYRLARLEGISLKKLLELNPHLKSYEGTGKHVKKGTKVKV